MEMNTLFYVMLFSFSLIEITDARAIRSELHSLLGNEENTTPSCPNMAAPVHGAVACINTQRGRHCSVFCNQNHDVPRSTASEPAPDVFTCDASGNWSPNQNVPDCSALRIPTISNLPSEHQYFSGKCASHSATTSITNSFLQVLKNSTLTSDLCTTTDECNLDNVIVSCHSAARRHPHQVASPHINDLLIGAAASPVSLQEMGQRVRAAQERIRSKANGDVSGRVSGAASASGEVLERAGNTEEITDERLLVLAKRILDLFRTGQDIVTGFFESHELGDAVNDYLIIADADLDCEDGYIPSTPNNTCVPCTAGQYFDRFLRVCRTCDFGFYQDSEAQTECTPCDAGQWTLAEGSTNRTDCRDQCGAGQFSTSGFSPCSPCSPDTFQPLIGQTHCLRCPEGKRTLGSGATQGDQCSFIPNL